MDRWMGGKATIVFGTLAGRRSPQRSFVQQHLKAHVTRHPPHGHDDGRLMARDGLYGKIYDCHLLLEE